MLHRWVALALTLLAPLTGRAQVSAAEYAQHRDSLVSRLPDGVVVALGAAEPKEDYLSFYQAPRFIYLTGYAEPDAALVMVKRGGQAQATLFVQSREPAREVWTGTRLGTEGAARRTGLAARTIDQLRPVLDSLAASGLPFHVVGDFPQRGAPQADGGAPLSADQQLMQSIAQAHAGLRVVSVDSLVDRLRGRKSPAELDLIRRAVEITVAAQREAMRAIEPGMNEFEIQALIEYTFRRNGADRPSFATIVGSGPNGATLHYNADDRFMSAGETVVMDVGASYRGYAADVTRTVPVSGTFTPDQRAIYQIVRSAQAAAERQAKVGAQAGLMDDSASVTLARGIARLGLIESPVAMYDCEYAGRRGQCPQLQLYYMHGLGHGIGLEVHDPDQVSFTGVIAPGSAFTIEPGIYVRADVLDHLPDTPRNRALVARLRPVVDRYKNIGIRIEDDYIVTERGVEWISRAPREIAEIEALMKEPFTAPARRNPAMVEWYRRTAPATPEP